MCEGYSLGCSLSPLEPLNPTFWTFKHSNKQLVLPRTVTTTPNTFVSTTQIKSHPITPQLCKHFFFFCHCSQPCAPKHCLTTLPPPVTYPNPPTRPPTHQDILFWDPEVPGAHPLPFSIFTQRQKHN